MTGHDYVPRYFKVEAALKKDPSNRALRQEFRELKEYEEFLKTEALRDIRHKALRLSRSKFEPKQSEPEHDTPDDNE